MAQNITLMGASYPDVPAVMLPKTGGGTARFTDTTPTTATDSDVTSGKIYFKSDGTQSTGTASGGGGTGMNKQVYFGSSSVAVNTYTATDLTLKVAVAGTYTVSWVGVGNTTSGTSGSQLYRTRNGTTTALGTANTTFSVTNYAQRVELTGQSFQANDVITVYARARSNSYQMHVANLVIEQTA